MKRIPKFSKETLIEMLKTNDYSQSRLATKLGLSRQRVHAMLKRNNIKLVINITY